MLKIVLTVLLFLILYVGFGNTCEKLENFPEETDTFKHFNKIYHPAYGELYIFDEKDAISSVVLRGDIWERHICEAIADNYTSGTDMLDIGANLGLNSIYSNKIKPFTGVVHLFEPQSDVFTMLKFNVKSIQNKKLYNITLGGTKPELLSFSQNSDNIGGTNIKSDGTGDVNVASVPLDLIEFPNKISFIKMDVEGAEYNVLLGARKTLEKHRPVILIEMWKKNYEKVKKLLESFGYFQTAHLDNDDYIFKFRD